MDYVADYAALLHDGDHEFYVWSHLPNRYINDTTHLTKPSNKSIG